MREDDAFRIMSQDMAARPLLALAIFALLIVR